MVPSEFDGYWNMAEISAYTNEYLGALVSRMEEEILNTAAPQEQDSPERDERDERNEGQGEGNTRQNVESIKAWLTERTRPGRRPGCPGSFRALGRYVSA